MSADEGSVAPLDQSSPSLQFLGGEGEASGGVLEQDIHFQEAVWSLLHAEPEELQIEDDLLHDASEGPLIEDEPQGFLPDSVLEEELERAWYSQAEDTEVTKSSSAWEVVPPLESRGRDSKSAGAWGQSYPAHSFESGVFPAGGWFRVEESGVCRWGRV